MQRKYIQKLIDIRGRANLSKNSLFKHLFIDLETFENSAAALRGSWQRSHYLWIMRPQCCLELLWKNSTQETQTWRYLTLQIFTPRETLAAQLWRKASHFLWASLETGDSYCFVLILLILTSLLEPFWPDGTGCARGFLSALDAAWMLRSWSLQVIARR